MIKGWGLAPPLTPFADNKVTAKDYKNYKDFKDYKRIYLKTIK